MSSYIITLSNKEYLVEICSVCKDSAEVNVNGEKCSVSFMKCVESKDESSQKESTNILKYSKENKNVVVSSPLPGVVVSINIEPGQAVVKGQTIAVVEAMKMENEIVSELSGTVISVLVQKGDSILEGAPIASIG